MAATPSLTARDLVGVLGMIPTPSVDGADHWSCEHSVDLDQTAAMTRMVIDGGVRIFLTNGSLGEGASLLEHEHQDFTRCIADIIKGRGLLFAGITTLNTRETIRRARGLMAAGANGLFLGRPMWMSLDPQAIVRYYADIAEALPGVPLIVYDNQFAFKAKIDTPTYASLSRNPSVIAAKHIGGPAMADDLRAVEGRMRILPLDTQWGALARAHPEEATACWSGNAADGPEPLTALASAIAARDWARVDAITARMAWAQAPMFPGGKLENYNIPIAHARLAGSGFIKSGPPRPPHIFAPQGHLEGGRETGRRWASLRAEFGG